MLLLCVAEVDGSRIVELNYFNIFNLKQDF